MHSKINHLIVLLVVFLIAACGESMEQKAEKRLANAKKALTANDFQKAKLELDSLRILYPKAFKARRAALTMMRNVEMAEQERSIAYYDSLLVSKEMQLDTLKTHFILEKNNKYQELGNYMVSSQVPMKNIDRTYLRGQVDETGEMTLTSIYKGNPISHTAIKVAYGDTYAQASQPLNNYVSSHRGVTTERVDFRFGKDEGVIAYIAINSGNSIKVELQGKSKFNYSLPVEDVNAIASLYNLSMLLQTIREIKTSREEGVPNIELIKKNSDRGAANDSIK